VPQYRKYFFFVQRKSYLISIRRTASCSLQFVMDLPPFEHLHNVLHRQPIVHINYLNINFPQANFSIHAVVTVLTIRWNVLRPKASSVDSSAHTVHKSILSPLPSFKVRLNSQSNCNFSPCLCV